MDFSDPVQMAVFFEIHSGLPREGPGIDASTLRALDAVRSRLPSGPVIADMACGPGSSAIPLARALPDARIMAIDLVAAFVEETNRRASQAGVSDRIDARVADMASPPCAPASLDMIWCESGIYNLGVETALETWRPLLKPEGCVVFNEVIWKLPEAEREAPVTAFWAEYPAMTTDGGVRSAITNAGYRLLEAFDLPDSDWWANYYDPIEAKLPALEARYAGNAAAEIVLQEARHEIGIRRRYPAAYDYRFYCLERA